MNCPNDQLSAKHYRFNKMEKEGFELVSCSITPSSKGILVFRQIKAPQPTEVCEHEKG